MGWGIGVNPDITKLWLGKLAGWTVFILLLAAVRQDLHPSWAEIAWLIGAGIAFVALCMALSFAVAALKIAWRLKGARGRTATRWSQAGQASAALDCAYTDVPSCAARSGH